MHDGGIADRKLDRKEVWIFANLENPQRCCVRLVEKYLSLCPLYYRKNNFYLQWIQKPTPKQWYGKQVIGVHMISKVVTDLMDRAKIQGFFTNHSLRHSGGTRLFRAGVDRKLIKEVTGHCSDAVDSYQITSMEQKKMMSNVLKGKSTNESQESQANVEKVEVKETEGHVQHQVCRYKCGEVNRDNVAEVIAKIIGESSKKGKTVIKSEIEIHNE